MRYDVLTSIAVPLLGGWLADVKWGRYKTICIGVAICGVAHIIMVLGAMPVVLKAGHGMAPFVVSLMILAFGAGKFGLCQLNHAVY